MKQLFGKVFIVFLVLFFASCAAKDPQQKIRIVDLDGRSHSLTTKVPELNKQALAAQGVFREQSENFSNTTPQNQMAEPQNVAVNTVPTTTNIAANNSPNYSVVSEEAAVKTLPVKQPTKEQEEMVNAGKQSSEAVEYDLSKPEEDIKPETYATAEKKPVVKAVAASKSDKGLFVQVGSFSNHDNAEKRLSEMQKFHKGHVQTVEGDKTMYRVLLGPFVSKPKALALVKKIKASGHEAVLMRNK